MSSNGHRWSKFWWQDWQNDQALRRVGFGARGLWMDMLCIANDGEPRGYLRLNGQSLGAADLADMLPKATVKEVTKLLAELEGKGVFSRDEDGTIYSRRMVKDAAATEAGKEWGKTGGNPALNGKEHKPKKPQGGLTPPDNPPPYQEPLSPPVNTQAYRPPLTTGVNLQEADSDSEAEERKQREESQKYLAYLRNSAREAADRTPTQIAAENIVGRVTRSLESSARQPVGKRAQRTVIEQVREVVLGPVLDGEVLPPEAFPAFKRGPVEPQRTVAEQLAALGYPA